MIIKTLFLASFLIASALASGDEGKKPFPAALLVQSNFDFSLIRKEFRVHYGGPKAGSSPTEVSINIYSSNGVKALSYDLKDEERKTSQAFHFAVDDVQSGKYEVEVCADGECSARTPSLTDFVTSSGTHKLSCKPLYSNEEPTLIDFIEPTAGDWAQAQNYAEFSKTINEARAAAARATGHAAETYQTDFERYGMNKNPSYQKTEKRLHTAILHNLKNYQQFFKNGVNDYCGRKYMLSLHSHIVDTNTKKVLHRFKTVNHLSDGGKQLFILSDKGGKILLESTHEGVDITAGTYQVWVSLCVTDKDAIESTYCSNPITQELTVASE